MKIPLFDIDNWKEITATLARNKTRTILTAFGIFWGTAMLALLMGGSKGMQGLLQRNFSDLATNSAIIHPNRTQLAYKGFKKGSTWAMTQSDVDNIRMGVDGIKASSSVLSLSMTSTAKYGTKNTSTQIHGVESEYRYILTPVIYEGRFINESDVRNQRKVCVVGKNVADDLFKTESPIGNFIEIDNIYYKVVGVAGQTSQIEIDGKIDDIITLPLTTVRRAYNLGDKIGYFFFEMNDNIKPSDIQARMEHIIRLSHPIHPDDKQAINFIDISEEFKMVDNLFTGVDILALFVGLGSLLAGIIGVGNIMWIIVKERTQEIGIRRAIGAKPRDIIIQILSESMVLTIIAGVFGICFSVLILFVLAKGTSVNGVEPGFQLPFSVAIYILLTFLILGSAAGLIPSIKAMRIKPIEALNDK
jgi:putative ABC transport system permease protein